MPRFYCPDLPAPASPLSRDATAPRPALPDDAPQLATLPPEEAHHARRVLRLAPGDGVELFNGRGTVASGVLDSWSDGATVRLTAFKQVPPLRPVLDLAVAIPKGPRADEMVNQLSQLGVDRLIPLLTERGVVDPRPGKLEKWRRIAVESAKQCGRAWLMEIAEPAGVAEVLRAGRGLCAVASPEGAATADCRAKLMAAEHVLLLIGPEGGWTMDEQRLAEARGALRWRLAPFILRIETAAGAAAALARGLAT